MNNQECLGVTFFVLRCLNATMLRTLNQSFVICMQTCKTVVSHHVFFAFCIMFNQKFNQKKIAISVAKCLCYAISQGELSVT